MVRRSKRESLLRWRVLLGILCLSLGFVVAACGGDDGGDGGGEAAPAENVDVAAELKKPANLTVWAWTPGTEEAVAMFEKEYPNIDVKLQNVGQGEPHYQKLRTVLKSGKGMPDLVHMEFQYIPSFTITEDLLDLKPYLPDDFLSQYPDWITSQINLDGAIYGVPWDTGPLGFVYRKDLLDKAGITEPPKTWDEFADAARKYHEANPDSYLVNMPGAQTGQWLGLHWQNGARPFQGDAENLTVNLTDPKMKEVTDFWDPLIEEGVISTDPDFVDAWFQGMANGKYAGWVSAAWGPIFLQGTAAKTSGKWRAAPLPQWDEGETVSGNWGGSTLAALKSTKFPVHAAELARWMLTEPEPMNMFVFDRFLFPPLTSMLDDPKWLDAEYDFYGGQQVNKVYAEMNEAVGKDWVWTPIHEFVNSEGNDLMSKALERGEPLSGILQPWQDRVVEYAQQQGITVAGQ